MIIGGILCFVIGLITYVSGSQRSNDIDAIMNDLFQSGVADDGSDKMTLGIVLMIIGVILILAGVILKNTKQQTLNHNTPHTSNLASIQAKINCNNCGSAINRDCQFCPICGEKINHSVNCAFCGKQSPFNSKFCINCGKELHIVINNQDSGV